MGSRLPIMSRIHTTIIILLQTIMDSLMCSLSSSNNNITRISTWINNSQLTKDIRELTKIRWIITLSLDNHQANKPWISTQIPHFSQLISNSNHLIKLELLKSSDLLLDFNAMLEWLTTISILLIILLRWHAYPKISNNIMI